MLGKKTDILGTIPEKMSILDNPKNIYAIGDFTIKWDEQKQTTNKHYELASMRYIPQPISTAKTNPVKVSLKEINRQLYNSGLAIIPNTGLWKNLFERE